MTTKVQGQRKAILDFLDKAKNANTTNQRLYNGFRFLYELEDRIDKILGTDEHTGEIIRRMSEQGYIKISKSANMYKVLRTK